ncbi:MAG: hypothetical protein ACHQ03_06685 [Candidatus Bathyarchaeia archaeon]
MVTRKLYAILGIVCGFILIDYGFNFLAVGFPGAEALTSQFVGGSLALGGSAAVFVALYSLLSPMPVPPANVTQEPVGPAPDISAEIIVEEQTGSQYAFYKHIEYIGYFFTAIGLFSGADLILQVFIHQLYNETRWWIEVLLVTFGVLSFAIFGSIGRIGAQEEREMALRIPQTTQTAPLEPVSSSGSSDVPQIPTTIEVRLADFVKSPSGDFEHRLSERVYDMIRVQPDMISIWREERQEIRAVYLAGPYELTREYLEEQLKRGEELKVGIISLPLDVIQDLLKPQSATVSA